MQFIIVELVMAWIAWTVAAYVTATRFSGQILRGKATRHNRAGTNPPLNGSQAVTFWVVYGLMNLVWLWLV